MRRFYLIVLHPVARFKMMVAMPDEMPEHEAREMACKASQELCGSMAKISGCREDDYNASELPSFNYVYIDGKVHAL